MDKNEKKPSIILVSGAWHTEFHCRPVIPYFQNAGYDIITQPLKSAGNPSPAEEDIAIIQAAINAELAKGKNVAVVLHSMGGRSGCEAVNRVLAEKDDIDGKRLRIIFLASFVDSEPIAAHFVANDYMRIDSEKGIAWTEKPGIAFYNDMEPEHAQPFIDALAYQKLQETPKFSSDKWQSLPLTYIICTQDTSVLPELQQEIAREFKMQEVRLETAHCPFISQPAKFVETVDSILKS